MERSRFEKLILKMTPASGIMIPASGFMTHAVRADARECLRAYARVSVRVPTPRVGGRLVLASCCGVVCVCEKIYGISSLRFPNPESRFWKEETGEIEWAERGSQRGSVRIKKACDLMLYTLKKSLV